VIRFAGDRPPGLRTRALIVLLWPAGLRIHEALALAESDLDLARPSILIRWSATAARATLRRLARTRLSAVASPHISCAMPTPSRWHARASHCS
jgi:integrase